MLSCVCVFSSGGVASGTDNNGGIIGVDTSIAVLTISEKFIFSASNTLTYGQVRCDVSVKLNMVASSLLCHVFVWRWYVTKWLCSAGPHRTLLMCQLDYFLTKQLVLIHAEKADVEAASCLLVSNRRYSFNHVRFVADLSRIRYDLSECSAQFNSKSYQGWGNDCRALQVLNSTVFGLSDKKNHHFSCTSVSLAQCFQNCSTRRPSRWYASRPTFCFSPQKKTDSKLLLVIIGFCL